MKFVLIVCLIFSVLGTVFAEDSIETLTHDETERTYRLHLPTNYEEADSLPLVVALHPSASSANAMAALTGIDAAADEQGFIAVYPNSLGIAWNDGRAGLELKTDDAGYIASLIDDLSNTYKVDTEKISLIGWAGGGLMAYRLACQMPEKFNSVAVVGALMWAEQRDICAEFETDTPVNMLIVRGTADWIYHAETYHSDYFGAELLGVQDTLDFWVERNGCTAERTIQGNNLALYEGCGIAAYEVLGSKQNWPRIGAYDLNQVGVDATQMITGFFAGEEHWAVEQPAFSGLTRNYTLYVPHSYDSAQPMPLVIALHGRTQSMTSMANMTDWNGLAEREQAIIVYPEGIDLQWNYYYNVPGFDYDPHDDFAFFTALIADLSHDLPIDQNRIYMTGFSNGGFMVNRLACEMPDQFAAFASVGGSASGEIATLCAPEGDVNMLIMHGTADNNILWNGIPETYPNGVTHYIAVPISGLFTFWGTHNGCDVEQYETEDVPPSGNSPGTNVRIIRMTDCPDGEEVVLYGVAGGGHNWPGFADALPVEIGGTVNLDINATEEIWEFFSRH